MSPPILGGTCFRTSCTYAKTDTAGDPLALDLSRVPPGRAALALFQPGSLPKWFPSLLHAGQSPACPASLRHDPRAVLPPARRIWESVYYNWLAFPLVAGTLALIAVNALELLLDRNILARAHAST